MGRGAYDTVTPHPLNYVKALLEKKPSRFATSQKDAEAQIAAERQRRDMWHYEHGFEGEKATEERQAEESRRDRFLEETQHLVSRQGLVPKPKPPPKPRR